MVVLGMKPALFARFVASTFALACVLRTACVPASKATPAPWGRLKPALHVRFMHVNVDVVAETWWVEKILHQEGAMPEEATCRGVRTDCDGDSVGKRPAVSLVREPRHGAPGCT